MNEAISLWLQVQPDRVMACAIRRELTWRAKETELLRERVRHMEAGFPDGVTREEWEILRELRAATR